MNEKNVKSLIDICFRAKQVTEMMPKLPKDVKPRHIHIIEAIENISHNQEYVKISDISKSFNITMPSVTKLINEMVKINLVRKINESVDKRINFLELTEKGLEYYDIYSLNYYRMIAKKLKNMEIYDISVTDKTIENFYSVVKEFKNIDLSGFEE